MTAIHNLLKEYFEITINTGLNCLYSLFFKVMEHYFFRNKYTLGEEKIISIWLEGLSQICQLVTE